MCLAPISSCLCGCPQKLDKELEQALSALEQERESTITNLNEQVCIASPSADTYRIIATQHA